MVHSAFAPAPPDLAPRVLGVHWTHNHSDQSFHFQVPAHVLATLNVAVSGKLWQGSNELPSRFATLGHTHARRYCLAAGASLATLFCRADFVRHAVPAPLKQFINQWLPPATLFPAWSQQALLPSKQAEVSDIIGVEDKLWGIARAQTKIALSSEESLSGKKINGKKLDSRIDAVLGQLSCNASTIDFHALAKELDCSQRTIQRSFLEAWGVPLKFVQRLFRLNAAITLWSESATHSNRPENTLVALALNLGLHDQAHLAKEFRELMGESPSRLKSEAPASNEAHLPAKLRKLQLEEDLLWALKAGSAHLTPMLSHFSKT